MRKLHYICRTSVYLHASIVGLAIGVGNSAIADLDLESSVQGIHGADRHTAGIHGGDRSIRGIHGGDRTIQVNRLNDPDIGKIAARVELWNIKIMLVVERLLMTFSETPLDSVSRHYASLHRISKTTSHKRQLNSTRM